MSAIQIVGHVRDQRLTEPGSGVLERVGRPGLHGLRDLRRCGARHPDVAEVRTARREIRDVSRIERQLGQVGILRRPREDSAAHGDLTVDIRHEQVKVIGRSIFGGPDFDGRDDRGLEVFR